MNYSDERIIVMTKALDEQVGGEHYKGMVIQPVEFIQKNRLGFVEGNIIKYICRWRAKNGLEDLHKVRHYIDLLIDIETTTGPVQTDLDMELTFGDHQAAKLKRLNDVDMHDWDTAYMRNR